MFVNAVKFMIRKYRKTVSMDIALGRRRRATKQVILEENAFAEAYANSSNSTVCGTSIARTLDIQWETVHMILHEILKYPYNMHIL